MENVTMFSFRPLLSIVLAFACSSVMVLGAVAPARVHVATAIDANTKDAAPTA